MQFQPTIANNIVQKLINTDHLNSLNNLNIGSN